MRAADTKEHLSFELAGTLEASAAARRLLLAGNGTLPANVRHDVHLLLTELVNNAVRHAKAGPDATVYVEVRQGSRTVSVAVYDEGPGFATPPAVLGRDKEHGWGLLIVDRIANSWAVTPTPTGTCVSFEIQYDEPPPGHRVAQS